MHGKGDLGPGLLRGWLIPYFFFTGLLFGLAYVPYQHFDLEDPRGSNDAQSYMAIARGDQEAVVPTHRYRVLIPWAVRLGASITQKTPSPEEGDTSGTKLRLILFLLTNTTIVGLAAVLLFRMVLAYVPNVGAAALGALVLIANRYTIQLAGLPMVDSLYLLALAAGFYALRTGSRGWLAFAILLGPLAKEQFIFVAPIIFVFSPLSRTATAGLFGLSLVPVVLLRMVVDAGVVGGQDDQVAQVWNHIQKLVILMSNRAGLRGIVEMATVYGPFWLVLAVGCLGGAEARRSWTRVVDAPLWWLLPAVLIQMVLSGNVGRMALFSFPMMAVAVAAIVQRHPTFRAFFQQLRGAERARLGS